jgi:hypothetical protein
VLRDFLKSDIFGSNMTSYGDPISAFYSKPQQSRSVENNSSARTEGPTAAPSGNPTVFITQPKRRAPRRGKQTGRKRLTIAALRKQLKKQLEKKKNRSRKQKPKRRQQKKRTLF